MTRKLPMTADDARANISAMRAETPANAMRRLITIALGPLGNLSDEARAIYQEALS